MKLSHQIEEAHPPASEWVDCHFEADELLFLCNDIRQKVVAHVSRIQTAWDGLPPFAARMVNEELLRLEDELRLLSEKLTCLPYSDCERTSPGPESITDFRDLVRAYYARASGLLQSLEWQSPALSSSLHQRSGPFSEQILEKRLDYCRDRHVGLQGYEQQLIELGVQQTSPQRSQRALLCSSGMGAFQTIVSMVAAVSSPASRVHVGSRSYHESLCLLRNTFGARVLEFDETNIAGCITRIAQEQPSAIFLDTLTNTKDLRVCDISKLLAACTQLKHDCILVIDSTCSPLVWQDASDLKNLPSNVSVIFWESLAKYYQFGLDLVTGGYLFVDATPQLSEELWRYRSWSGTVLPQQQSNTLPQLDPARLRQRFLRIAGNTHTLARRLDDYVRNSPLQKLLQINHPQLPSHPDFVPSCSRREPLHSHSGFLTLSLAERLCSSAMLEDIRNSIIASAAQRSIQLCDGTSFGFAETRIGTIALSQGCQQAFIRISAGTESPQRIGAIAEAIFTGISSALNSFSAVATTSVTPHCIRASKSPKREQRQLPASARLSTLNLFEGDNALQRFLNPGENSYIPLVELPLELNPLRAEGIRIYAKLMYLVPLLNIKSLPAFNMLNEAISRGESLEQGLLESSSLNTSLSLGVASHVFGVGPCRALVDDTIHPLYSAVLRLFGVEVLLQSTTPGSPSRVQRAISLAEEQSWFHAGQYNNLDNPRAHEQWTGPQIWEQLQGELDVFCSSLGTAGTIIGSAKALKGLDPQIQVLGTLVRTDEFIPGPRSRERLGDVGFAWQGIADHYVEVSQRDAYEASVRMMRYGIMGGPSSGMNLSGLIEFLQANKKVLREQCPRKELKAAFICCDTPFLHIDRYLESVSESMLAPSMLAPCAAAPASSSKPRSSPNISESWFEQQAAG